MKATNNVDIQIVCHLTLEYWQRVCLYTLLSSHQMIPQFNYFCDASLLAHLLILLSDQHPDVLFLSDILQKLI